MSPPQTARTPPGAARGPAREQAILTAALDLLAERGYEALTMDAVAERAHASKATIYRRWPDKAALAVAALRAGEEIPISTEDTGSLRGDLLALLRALHAKFSGDGATLTSGLLHAMQSDPELAASFRSFLAPRREEHTARIVQRARDRAEIPTAADHGVLLDLVPAVLLTRILLTGEDVDEAYLTHVVDDLLIPLLAGSSAPGGRRGPDPRRKAPR